MSERKSVYERIAEAQKKGTFEGNMLSQGKDIRYLNDEYFNTHSREEMSRDMNQQEWEYYHSRVETVGKRESAQKEQEWKEKVSEWGIKKNHDMEKAIQDVMNKQKMFPLPNRIPESKIKQDIFHIIGNPIIGDDSYLNKLKEYVGEASQGVSPIVEVGGTIHSGERVGE